LFALLNCIPELKNGLESNVNRIDKVETQAINGLSSVRMDIGSILEKTDSMDTRIEKNTNRFETVKKESDKVIEKMDEKIDLLKLKFEQQKSTVPTPTNAGSNVANFLSNKLDDVFSSGRFKKLENLEPQMNTKFELFDQKLKELEEKDAKEKEI
jgi:hypothetical protein